MAEKNANLCFRLIGSSTSSLIAFGRLSDLCQMLGIHAPDLSDSISVNGAVQRMISEHWWRRALRKLFAREIEAKAIVENRVNLFKSIYVSDEGLSIHREQKQRNRKMLEKVIAVNEEGKELTLAELADTSVSNPVNRRNELMCRIAGFEKYSLEKGHIALFWTITCPSRMHASLSKSGRSNPKYDGTTPAQAQKYLCDLWACIRAKFDRMGIKLYGFRVVEPQHDGTPHWHLLVFLPDRDQEQATKIVRAYSLMEDGHESGADKYRFKVEAIDRSKGSAAGYIAKYISKNIDGHEVEKDLYGNDAKNSSERVTAWASIWNIRQFQQVGGPSVSVWRELRRVREPSVNDPKLGDAWLAANSGDWCAFIHAMGGLECSRKDQTVNLSKEWSDDENQYGDPLGWLVNGVESSREYLCTRLHDWKIELRSTSKADELQCAEHATRAHSTAAQRPPWSPVNNCTGALQSTSNRPPPI
ncbi:replication endonuclease [Mariprofundus sp. EBB-1]|uniref:replication endonuclease n=1 Tax=Mariprofundus sp. EBB-1 TaxID=2650971 RepID=UPI000EF1C47E|nr:replication endonuclease [Mariprofundus sp. EBB-1]RLL52177.1 replication endonuclease [Mariprofundus sp. EBB-1]